MVAHGDADVLAEHPEHGEDCERAPAEEEERGDGADMKDGERDGEDHVELRRASLLKRLGVGANGIGGDLNEGGHEKTVLHLSP